MRVCTSVWCVVYMCVCVHVCFNMCALSKCVCVCVCVCVCACREVNVNHRNETIVKLSGENDLMDIVSELDP